MSYKITYQLAENGSQRNFIVNAETKSKALSTFRSIDAFDFQSVIVLSIIKNYSYGKKIK